MDDKIVWGRYFYHSGYAEIGENKISIGSFDFYGIVFRLKYNPNDEKFSIRKKSEVESIALERGADVVLRPPKGSRRKCLQGRLFLLKKT